MSRAIHIDPLSLVSLWVECAKGGRPTGGATAFVIQTNDQSYLVTNWHVVTGRRSPTAKPLGPGLEDPDSLRVWFHSAHGLGEWIEMVVALREPGSGSPRWLEHPAGVYVDVALLPFSPPADVCPYPLDLSLAEVDLEIAPSEPLSIIGFPLGLSSGGMFPIWKTGHLGACAPNG